MPTHYKIRGLVVSQNGSNIHSSVPTSLQYLTPNLYTSVIDLIYFRHLVEEAFYTEIESDYEFQNSSGVENLWRTDTVTVHKSNALITIKDERIMVLEKSIIYGRPPPPMPPPHSHLH